MVRKINVIKEVHAHGGEHPPFVRNFGVQNMVICRNAVGDHHQQRVIVNLVNLTHFSCGDVIVLGKFRTHKE